MTAWRRSGDWSSTVEAARRIGQFGRDHRSRGRDLDRRANNQRSCLIGHRRGPLNISQTMNTRLGG
jgi:hypothetical protein